MKVYESIMQGLTEAAAYQQGKIPACKTKLTIKPVDTFNTAEIKRIRQKTGMSQVIFAGSMGVSPKTVEAWENGRNKPEGGLPPPARSRPRRPRFFTAISSLRCKVNIIKVSF